MSHSLLRDFEAKQVEKLSEGKVIPPFSSGDTVRVYVLVPDTKKGKRKQAFEGVCIYRRNRGINSSFAVRRVSKSGGVERSFPLHSPMLASIELIKRGKVRQSHIYYMRKLSGKKARLKEIISSVRKTT